MNGTASFNHAFLKSQLVSVVRPRKSQHKREGAMEVPESSSGVGFNGETELIDHIQAAKGISPFTPEPEFMNVEKPSSSDTSNHTNQSKSKELHHHPQTLLLTARELHACIIASEGTRAVCSILIAVLVVSSYIARPLLGVDIISSKSILAAKPLYMVLLSDLTVVFAHFVLIKRRRRLGSTEGEEGEAWRDDELSWMRAVMVLERGLVVHQTVRAIFIDCSVYVVIVACGLSLV